MKPSRHTILGAAVTTLAVALGACATSGPPPIRPERSTDGTLVITAEQIAASNARDAWEVLRYSGAPVTLYDGGERRTSRIQRRGRSSMLLDDGALVIVDGTRLSDPDGLRNIRAATIGLIEILTGSLATQRYGTGAVGGAVVVRTRTPGSGGPA